MKKRIILASASPRRKELLKKIVEEFEVIVSDFDEDSFEYTDYYDYVTKCSLYKAEKVYDDVNDENSVVISADTVVVCEGNILQKPSDKEDAYRILKSISGKKIIAITGYSIIAKDKKYNEFKEMTIEFGTMTDEEIYEYIATNEPMDKAGAFGIQGIGMKYIDGIVGDYATCVGLPIRDIYLILKENFII